MKFIRSKVFLSILVVLTNFVATFMVFMYNYNHLATPYLYEEQRVDNAIYIFSTTISMFAAISILTGMVFFLIKRKK